MALEAYRHVLRSIRIAFQGDVRLLAAARAEARHGFESRKSLAVDDEECRSALNHAKDVAQVLRKNVVQGRKDEGTDEKYKLRIHEEIERGDNDTVKLGKPGSPCS